MNAFVRNIFLIYFCLASKLYADHWIDENIIEYPEKETSFCEIISPFPDLEQIALNAHDRDLVNKWYAQKIKRALSIFGSGRFENWLMQVESINLLSNQDAILTAVLPCHQIMRSYPIRLINDLNYEILAEVSRGDFVSVSGEVSFELNKNGVFPEIISFKFLQINKIGNDALNEVKLREQRESTNEKNKNAQNYATKMQKGENASSEALLTASEVELFRKTVSSCWNLNVGSPEAYVSITLSFELDKDGKVNASTIKLVSNSDGSDAAVYEAFQSARRAILRCQGEGYPLPKNKYERWKFIEITFDPTDIRER